VLSAWGSIEKARGRPEAELVFGVCMRELGVIVDRDDGGQALDFNKLKDVADPEMRKAVLGAAWKAHEERMRA
jgi:hypothetical protein